VIASDPAPATNDGLAVASASGPAAGEASPRRRYLYSAGSLLVAVVAVALLPRSAPSDAAASVPVALTVVVGALMGVRMEAGKRPISLVMGPLVLAQTRLADLALPPLVLADLLAGLVRRRRPLTLVTSVAHDSLAFALAHAVTLATNLHPLLEAALFALLFAVLRWLLWHGTRRLGLPPADDPRAESADLQLSFLLVPVVAVPLLAWLTVGDSGLIAGLLAVLSLLSVVYSVLNLAAVRESTEQQRDRLARATALQDEMLHLMTHDLKNPLTTIRVYAQLGQKALADGRHARLPQYLDNIDRAGIVIERMVENLTQLSRLEQAAEQPPAEDVPAASLFADAVDVLRALAEQKQIELKVDLPDPAPVFHVSAALAHEALSNLVSNAIKYTPTGGQVRVWASAGPPGYGVAGVSDTGIGLSEADRQQLFQKFFRSANPRARQERGSGLGLALTHAIVLRMGGRIEVDSVLEQGTTFRLVLPLARIL
jgi:signal transduction histidine kinase